MKSPNRNKAIPDLTKRKAEILKYKEVLINDNQELYNEKYTDLRNEGIKGVNYYNTPNNPPYNQSIPGSIPELYIRKSVVKRLHIVNSFLKDFNLELYVFDCFRPFEVQNFMWYSWVPKYIKKDKPNISQEELEILRKEFTSKAPETDDEIDYFAPAPHSAGGAIDLTLKCIDSPDILTMGTIFDDFTEKSYTDYYEIKKNKSVLSKQEKVALENRRILYWAMKKGGFENYPYEWWHFSWGDQMWAVLSGAKEAFYSYSNPL